VHHIEKDDGQGGIARREGGRAARKRVELCSLGAECY